MVYLGSNFQDGLDLRMDGLDLRVGLGAGKNEKNPKN